MCIYICVCVRRYIFIRRTPIWYMNLTPSHGAYRRRGRNGDRERDGERQREREREERQIERACESDLGVRVRAFGSQDCRKGPNKTQILDPERKSERGA